MSQRLFRADLERGFAKDVRFGRGQGVNVWGGEVAALADRLDKLRMTPEVETALHELFEEIGQQARDAFG